MPFQWAASMKWPDGEDSASSALLRELLETQKEQGAKTQTAIERLESNINALRQEVRGARATAPPTGAAAPGLFGRGSCSLDVASPDFSSS